MDALLTFRGWERFRLSFMLKQPKLTGEKRAMSMGVVHLLNGLRKGMTSSMKFYERVMGMLDKCKLFGVC